jgi:hypothetical protein
MVVRIAIGFWADVHRRADELRYGVEQAVLGICGDVVCTHDVEVVIDDHTGLGTQPVADPAKADLFDLSHAGCHCNGGFSESGKFRVDGVHEASINAHSGGPEDKQDRDSDGKANDGVGLRESGQDAECAGDNSEGSEPVRSRVQTVGNKGRRADLPADADPVDGDQFVAAESDEAGGTDDPRIANWLGVEKPVHGLVARDNCRCCDHGHDEDACEVFGTAVAIGISPAWPSSAKPECNPERDRSQRVGEIVDGVNSSATDPVTAR